MLGAKPSNLLVMNTILFSDSAPGSGKTRLLLEMITARSLDNPAFVQDIYPRSQHHPDLFGYGRVTPIVATPTIDLIHQTVADFINSMIRGFLINPSFLPREWPNLVIVASYATPEEVFEGSPEFRPVTTLEASESRHAIQEYIDLYEEHDSPVLPSIRTALLHAAQSKIQIAAFRCSMQELADRHASGEVLDPISVQDQLSSMFKSGRHPQCPVFMTHSGFSRMPYCVFGSRVEVYFDESRRFVSTENPTRGKLFFPGSLARRLLEKYSEPLEAELDDGQFLHVKAPSQFSSVELYQEAIALSKTSSASDRRRLEADIGQLGERLRASRNPRIDTFIERSALREKLPIRFYHLTNPERLFSGYSRVFVFAAYFMDSEFFHLMESRSEAVEFVNLKDYVPIQGLHSWKLLQSRHDRIRNLRYSKIRLHPLTLSTSRPSKMRSQSYWLPNSRAAAELQRTLSSNGVSLKTFKTALSDPKHVKNKTALGLLESLGCDVTEDRFWRLKALFAERVAEFLPPGEDRCLVADTKDDPVDGHDYVLPNGFVCIPQLAHGLNQFRTSNAILYLRGLNPNPKMVSLLKELTRRDVDDRSVHYDLTDDLPLDLATQALCRTSIRMADATEEVHIFTMDLWLAQKICKKLVLDESVIDTSLATGIEFLHDLRSEDGGVVKKATLKGGTRVSLVTTSASVRSDPLYVAALKRLKTARVRRCQVESLHGADSKQFRDWDSKVRSLSDERDLLVRRLSAGK